MKSVGGVDPKLDDTLKGIARAMGWNEQEFLEFVGSPEGDREFVQCKVTAHGRGVFGAPIMMLDDQIWWGNDRLMFVEEYLRAHPA